MPIIVDLEATCSDDGSVARHEMEIIEIGAVAVDVAGAVVGAFSEFIRPVRNPALTAFCTQLTTITQAQVDAADIFPVVVKRFRDFVIAHSPGDIAADWWGSWGKYDDKQFAQDVQYHRATHPFRVRHRNLKEAFSERNQLKKRFGLGQAIERAGMRFEGTAHRGIDDARNIARLLPYIDGDARLDGASVSSR